MSTKHQSPAYQKNAKIIRRQVKRMHDLGEPVACWRCGRPIHPRQPFDVGHINDSITSDLSDLAPEHRHGTRMCTGNRSAGGRLGAAKTNGTTPIGRRPAGNTTTWSI